MAGFADVLLRGIGLFGAGLTLGGVVFSWLVLDAGPGTKPAGPVSRALGLAALGAGLTATAQLSILLVSLGALATGSDGWPLGPYFGTAFAGASLARLGLATGAGLLAARLARRPGGRMWWTFLGVAALSLVGSSAWLSHAMARIGERGLLLALDAVHQIAAAAWIGGLAHLLVYVARRREEVDHPDGWVARRFSRVALCSVVLLVGSGAALSVVYVGDLGGLVGTAYGVMVLTKAVLLAAILVLAFSNYRLVRRVANPTADVRLARFVEVETGLAVTVLFAAASLTSQPPAVDVRADRASLAEVGARFAPTVPRLVSPSLEDVRPPADSSAVTPGVRRTVDREWSEFNHHWAGLFVLAIGLLGALERRGVGAARHWPLLFIALAGLLFFRNDPEVWPLGPVGFWESLRVAEVLQHRLFVLMIVAFGLFEWAVRTGRLRERPWSYVFPVVCAVGGGLLLTHSHAVFNLKEEFLMEVTHAPLGILGAVAGWARWLEVRMPAAGPMPGRIWPACMTAVGVLLLVYREP